MARIRRATVTQFRSENLDWEGNTVRIEGTVTVEPKLPPLVGAACGGKNPAESLANFNTLNAACGGNLGARRSYAQVKDAVPNHVASTAMFADMVAQEERISIWSFKPDLKNWNSGLYDQAFKDLLFSIEHQAYITIYHEPGSEFRQGLFKEAEWHAAINRLGSLVHTFAPRDRIKTYICLEGRWAMHQSGFAAYNYWGDGFNDSVDAIGLDQYSQEMRDVQYYLTTKLLAMTEAPMDWARRKKKPIIIPEWGVTDNYGQVGKAELMASFWEWCVTQPDIAAMCYFNNNQEVANGDPLASYAVHDESLLELASIAAASQA